ncbi:transcription factor of the MADS box [Modicella reniformis]|uniref:Transcription factor of the MADS box n=1 Tax=Modicella reniformis TaxID=1440133 RepID=A0A9P6MBS8_9FUNG|nr:transcription factor of the MADS box [Modicella reniformis]
MTAKRSQAVAIGASDSKDSKDRIPEEGDDEHIDKKFKQDQFDGDGDGDDDDDGDEEEDVPKVGKRAGRRKIKIEYIEDKSRRHITFSKRKSGIMKKAYELSTLTGTQVLLLVVSETGLVYTFTTPKLQPLVTKAEGKNLIQACLHAPDKEATPDRYTAPEQEGSPGAESEDDRDENSSSPPQPSPQQQQQQQGSSQQPPSMSQNQPPPPYSSPSAMGMYPAPYNHIPFPTQSSGGPGAYNYPPNMGMGYQQGPPNPNGPPPSQYWPPPQQQQQGGSAPPSSSPVPTKGGRGEK